MLRGTLHAEVLAVSSPDLVFAVAANPVVDFGGWQIQLGDYTVIDLIAATTNALNGALLARRPNHYKNWTIVGILLMALLEESAAASRAMSLSTRLPAP